MPENKAETIGLFLTGTVLGLTIGLLYAPESGKRTRKRIKRRTRQGIEHLDELQEDFRIRVNDWVEEVTETVDGGLHRGRKLSVAGKERVLGVLEDARQRLDLGRERIERFIHADG